MQEYLEKIKHNLFTNDTLWKERAEENTTFAHKIREFITMDNNKTITRKEEVETIDFLESHNL